MLETIDVFSLAVHPDADLFPMLPEDELQAMADDIRENGLNEPLVIQQIDGQWLLIDGRNRREACRLADVTPAYRVIESDPKAYIYSANITRRNLNKGQQAIAVAMLYPDPGERGRGKKSLLSHEFDGSYLSMARSVLRLSPKLAADVLNNPKVFLRSAYNKIIEIEEERQEHEKKLQWLQQYGSKYLGLIEDNQLTIDAAIAAAKSDMDAAQKKKLEEEKAEKDRRDGIFMSFYKLSECCHLLANTENIDSLKAVLLSYGDEYQSNWRRTVRESLVNISKMIDNIDQIKQLLQEIL